MNCLARGGGERPPLMPSLSAILSACSGDGAGGAAKLGNTPLFCRQQHRRRKRGQRSQVLAMSAAISSSSCQGLPAVIWVAVRCAFGQLNLGIHAGGNAVCWSRSPDRRANVALLRPVHLLARNGAVQRKVRICRVFHDLDLLLVQRVLRGLHMEA